MPRVVVLGASMTDMNLRLPHLPSPGQTLLGGDFFTGPGGKGANQAIAARRAGGEVTFLTALGDDPFGQALADHDRAEGLDMTHAKVVADVPSGVALIFVADDGENLIGVAMGANAKLTPDDIDALPESVFAPGGVFLASLEVPIDTVARGIGRARRAGMTVLLNPAPADRRLVDLGLMPLVDILTPNQTEAEALVGLKVESDPDLPRLADALLDLGVDRVVITLGRDGCLIADADGSRRIPATPVDVIDTVGAGDAFNGALAVALAEGRSLDDAARWASVAGALAVTKPGAQGGLPYRKQIEGLSAGPSPPGVSLQESS